MVSDYDLLALDQLGQTKNDKQLFPQADETWQVGQARARLARVARLVCEILAGMLPCGGGVGGWGCLGLLLLL